MTDLKMEESLRKDLTRADLIHDAQLQALAAQVASLIARLEEVNREGVDRSSALQATTSKAVIRTRASLEAAFHKNLLPETVHSGRSSFSPYVMLYTGITCYILHPCDQSCSVLLLQICFHCKTSTLFISPVNHSCISVFHG